MKEDDAPEQTERSSSERRGPLTGCVFASESCFQRLREMELNGALSNPSNAAPTSLYRLLELQRALLQRPPAGRPPVVAARPAPIIQTILFVLSCVDRPMRATEIHAAAEGCVGHGLNWSSVKNALSEHARRQDGLIRRIDHGVYQLCTESAAGTA